MCVGGSGEGHMCVGGHIDLYGVLLPVGTRMQKSKKCFKKNWQGKAFLFLFPPMSGHLVNGVW